MNPPTGSDTSQCRPWNPGIVSPVPRELRHLCTLFRPANAFTSLDTALEMHDFTGFDPCDLVAFRPQRLALHELLVRVSADLSVPDGTRIEDLGINFRKITRAILSRYIEPEMDAITAAFDSVRRSLADIIATQLATLSAEPAAVENPLPRGAKARLRAFFGARTPPAPMAVDEDREQRAIARWQADAQAGSDPLHEAACRALAKVVSAVIVRHGHLWGGRDLIAQVATNLACNDHGAAVIGAMVGSCVARAVDGEGLVVLPWHEQPVVMNTKGPSASGKSTLRPRQKKLAADIGVDWGEFALISPDIWRKQLLDYASLGSAYKYGGAFTGDEVRIVDQKLDRYMAEKARRGQMPHLLIDRFRFDSFAPDSDEAGSNLLTRFGQIVYLFFLVTPPHLLVERAWQRGRDVGRYKAVDDTLAHAVEAYSGMPELFFTWVRRTDKQVHFEFLDNTVARGAPPRPAAFGWHGVLNVLDVSCLINIERYRKLNVDALAPDSLYPDRTLLAAGNNCAFLQQCIVEFREVNFVDQASGRIYLRVLSGVPAWADPPALARAFENTDTRAGLLATLPAVLDPLPHPPEAQVDLADDEHAHTVGAWGAMRAGA